MNGVKKVFGDWIFVECLKTCEECPKGKITIMKKVFFGVLLAILIIASYIAYKNISFNPLKAKDFQILFIGYNMSFRKTCSKDFIGVSAHGELFEIYKYHIKGVSVSKNFPNLSEWEQQEITNKAVVGKWKNCPLDKQTLELYQFTLWVNNFDDVRCFDAFSKQVMDPRNYYSFIYFNNLEQYFFLYCSDYQEFYYIRRKGF